MPAQERPVGMVSDDGTLRLNLPRALWGWEPHESQRIWLDSDAQTKVAVCGRRWGKTEAAAPKDAPKKGQP